MTYKLEKFHYKYSKDRGSFEININEFKISQGEIVFFHGPSGCGKSTIMNVLSGVIPSEESDKCRKVFVELDYVMHESKLLPWQSVDGNIKVESKLRGKRYNERVFRELLIKFGLEKDICIKRAKDLSLGMRQRIEIAKALSFDARLLLLDEALSGIDSRNKRIVMKELLSVVQNKNMSILGSAHQLVDILMLSDRIYFVNDGKILDVIDIEIPKEIRVDMEMDEIYALDCTKTILNFQMF